MPTLAFDILARDRASKVFDQVAGRADRTNRDFAKVGSGMSNVIGKIGVGVAGLVGGWQAWDKVMVGGFNRLANLDDARKRLDQMGLSTDQAAKLMDGLSDTVTGTAFSLDAGAGAMTGFVSAGVDLDEVNKRLEMTADTAAFAQAPLDEIGNIFVKIQTQGKLTAEELNMLQERGVPALVLLADAAGVTAESMREMISRGEVSAERFFDLWEQGSKGFGENNIKIEGAAKSMGDTVRGALANAETALARLGAEILDDFMPAIREGADAFKDFGNVAIDALEEVDRFAKKTGLEKAKEKIEDFNVTGAEAFENLGKSAEKSNDIIEGFFKEVFGVENVSLMTILADETENVADKTKLFQSAAAGAKSDAADLADEMAEVADETSEATDAFSAYQDALKASTDPVFALHSAVSKLEKAQQGSKDAVRDLERAQEDLNELREDSDASTRDLEDAERKVADAQKAVTDSGWDVAEALAAIEAAAVNGDLSFSDFSGKLDEWVASGEITAAQADSIRERVAELTGTAEDYSGEYVADLLAETNKGKLDKAQRELDVVARARNPKYLAEIERRQEIQVKNRLDALADKRVGIFKPQMDEAARERTKARLDAVATRRRPEFRAELDWRSRNNVAGALNSLAAPRRATITVGYAVDRSGLPAGLVRGRQHGGPVEAHRPYIVGERGPEWFVPDRPGLVVSNKDSRALMRDRDRRVGTALGTGGSTTVQLINQGVIGSQREMERWLAESVNRLRRTGRLN